MKARYSAVPGLQDWTVHDSKTDTDLFPTQGSNRSYCYYGTPRHIAQSVASALNGMTAMKEILAKYDETLTTILRSTAHPTEKHQLRIDALVEFRDSIAKICEVP